MAIAAVLSGCAVGPNFDRPAPPRTSQYEPSGAVQGGQDFRIAYGADPEAGWWRLYGSSELDALVAEGLRASPTLAAAQAALRGSRDQLRAGSGIFYPQVGSDFAGGRERANSAEFGEPGKGATFDLFTLSASVDYALDLFGGERRTVEALKAQSEHQRQALGATWLALTGAIVDAAIAEAAYDAEAEALVDIVRQDELQRDVLTAEETAGTTSKSAVFLAIEQLTADQQLLAATQARTAQSEHLLKSLIGREPGETLPADPSAFDALLTPREVPVSLPSRLAAARPDILQAEADLHQASAEVGVATAALFPSVSLSAASGLQNNVFADLPKAESRFWSYGFDVDAPLFTGGQRWFQRRGAQEAYRGALASYRQTVLNALQQTADALQALNADDQALAAARAGLDAASATHALAGVNVQAGMNSDFDASDYALTMDRLRIAYVAARALELQDMAALYLASGGGWPGTEAQREAQGPRPAGDAR